MKPLTTLRVARPTNDLDAVVRFYGDGLGLSELYRFENHDGFDGVMLGRPGEAYHFEFTRAHGHDAGKAPTEDNLIVFYFPDRGDWETAHSLAQDVDDASGAWLHAYLHRKEGDLSNAGYWYRRAGRPIATDSLEQEWSRIAAALLAGR